MTGAAGALTSLAAPADEPRRTRFYVVETFLLKNGSQVPRVHEFLSKTAIPRVRALHAGPILAMESLIAPHMPQVAMIVGFASLEEMWNVHSKVLADPEFRAKFSAWQQGAEAPFESQTNILLEAANYSPELTFDKEPRKAPRVFELRVYHSPSAPQLQALHERFAGPEIKIFHRSGIHPLFYSSTVFGPQLPNLTYLIPFDSLEAREKAWNAFGADPEWVKVRQESIDKHGQISSVIQISLYKATPYSPIG